MTVNLAMGKMQGLRALEGECRGLQPGHRTPHTPTPIPTLVPPLTQQSAAGLPCWSLITVLFSGSLNLLEEFGPFGESSLRERPTQQPPSPQR